MQCLPTIDRIPNEKLQHFPPNCTHLIYMLYCALLTWNKSGRVWEKSRVFFGIHILIIEKCGSSSVSRTVVIVYIRSVIVNRGRFVNLCKSASKYIIIYLKKVQSILCSLQMWMHSVSCFFLSILVLPTSFASSKSIPYCKQVRVRRYSKSFRILYRVSQKS